MWKMIPKWSKNVGEHRKILPEICQTFRFRFPFWSQLLELSWGSAFCLRPVLGNLWGVPHWTDFGWRGPRLRPLGPIFLTFWKIQAAIVFQNSKIAEQQMAPTTPSNKQARIKKHFADKHAKPLFVYFCCLTKPRKSKAPGLTTNRVGETELPKE